VGGRMTYRTSWSIKRAGEAFISTTVSVDCEPDEGDRQDLARWLGMALAADNNYRRVKSGSGVPEQLSGDRALLEILNQIIGIATLVAWDGHQIPEWADKYLVSIKHGIHPSQNGDYRSWTDIQDDLITLIDSFSEHVDFARRPRWNSDDSVQGALALRLLAAQTKNLVSDEMVRHLTWLDEAIQSDMYSPSNVKKFRNLITVEWERSLLERVTKSDEQPLNQSATTDAPARRRLV
jgi:hypothetical protein